MVDLGQLGWDASTAIELDHRRMKAPHVKLRSAIEGRNGDVVYCVDLRICRPNTEILSPMELHSLEHFLLAGFQKYLKGNFISVAPMGCQTGFYLVLLNEGRAPKIFQAYEYILRDILNAVDVPFANAEQCGNYQNHSLDLAQELARRVLLAKEKWSQVV